MNKENIKVLLVGSQVSITSTSNILQKEKINFEIANSTQQALTSIFASHPDLILLVTTEEINGIDIYNFLRENQPQIAVIFITDSSTFVRMKAIWNGDNSEYIKNPFEPEELLVRVKKQLRIIQLEKELKVKNQQLAKLLERFKPARRAEAKLASAFRSSPDPIALVTFPDIYYTEVNDNFCNVFGYTRSQVIGRSASFVNIWVDKSECSTILDILQEVRKIRNYEIKLIGANNEVKTMLLSAELILIEEQQYLLGTARDITERKIAEEALQQREAQYRGIFENAALGIAEIELDNRFGRVNPQLCKILGYDESELLTLRVNDITHPEDLAAERKHIQQLLANQIHTYSLEKRLIRKNGDLIWVIAQAVPEIDKNGNIKGYIGTVTDITELKHAETALRESAERERATTQAIQRMRQTLDLETIFNATTEQLRQVINCDRVVVYSFNDDWSGQFVAESVGSGWKSLIEQHNIDANLTESAFEKDDCVVRHMDSNDNQVLDTHLQDTQGGAYSRGASFLCVPDIYSVGFETCYIALLERFQAKAYITVPIFCGSKLWGLLGSYQNSGSRQWKTGEINIVVQIGNQLGVALQQAELLAQMQLQSQALQKAAVAADAANRAKSEFLASMSHELRTPLNAILGFTQLMSRDNNLYKEHQQNLGIINRAGEHLLSLINDILEMSKIEAGRSQVNISSFDLIGLLDTLKEMLQFRATAKGLTLTFEYESNIPQYIQTDASKLRQVLLNLLSNAIKFTTSGCVKLRVAVTATPYQLYFEVTDTGLGISQSEISLVFEAFGQTETGRKSQQGTGLGLAISRKYVKMMGGDITFNSTVGIGSTFTFNIETVPLLSTDVSTTEPRQPIIGLAPNQPAYRVLLVDDAEDSRMFLVKLLASIGFQVKEAVNGAEAISIWSQWEPNLILMDLRMPMMDGYAATREIKLRSVQKNSSNTIIIALTANVFSEQRNAIIEAGCDDFINKPFREELLLEKIQQHLKLEYIYQDTTNPATENVITSVVLSDAEAVKILSEQPIEWIQQLHRIAASCSDSLIIDLLEQMPVKNPSLTSFLQDLARNFNFEKIMELTSF
jgi:two-component system, sensor histidine kinase and response regulator